MTSANQLRLRFLSVLSPGLLVGSVAPLACNTATTQEQVKPTAGGRATEPFTPTPTAPSQASTSTAPATPTAATATAEAQPKPSQPTTRQQLKPSCERGGGEVQCFARGSTHFMVGNVPNPEPPPKPHFDANNCQVRQEVHDGCCVPASTGPELINGECCYGFCTGTCCGRPLLVDGRARLAPPAARADWSDVLTPDVTQLDATARARLAQQWLEDARLEHASIASFARFTLELLAFGAPADLVQRSQQAMADELQHARACFALASAYAGTALGPGPLDLSGVAPAATLASAVAAAVREGCVNETIAALTASQQARAASDPTVRAVLERIARDEADHAELAWRFVDWALRAGGEPARAALAAALRPLSFTTSSAAQETAELRGSGRLTGAERQAIAASSWHEVILPCARALGAAGC